MKEGQPSSTAMNSAMVRAAHLCLDDHPKILRDDLAIQLSGFENEVALAAALETPRQTRSASGR
jgi:O-methyltransferase involved in polyketide biosynthesis